MLSGTESTFLNSALIELRKPNKLFSLTGWADCHNQVLSQIDLCHNLVLFIPWFSSIINSHVSYFWAILLHHFYLNVIQSLNFTDSIMTQLTCEISQSSQNFERRQTELISLKYCSFSAALVFSWLSLQRKRV